MMHEGHTVDLVYLDFAKAFESVNHRFLLPKQKSFGVDGAVLNCIKPFLSIPLRITATLIFQFMQRFSYLVILSKTVFEASASKAYFALVPTGGLSGPVKR